MTTTETTKHPKGLYLLFFTEMWERFSYYGMRGLLILYLTKTYLSGGLEIEKGFAGMIYGLFTGLVYFTPIIGGWLADNFLGQRKSIMIGGILMMIGQFSLASQNFFGVQGDLTFLFIGLFLLIIGNGFFKPNISIVVGGLYSPTDKRRDSAFTIFYMGINIGAFFAPLICGYFSDNLFSTEVFDVATSSNIKRYAYEYAFLTAGIGMLIGQVLFMTLAQKYLGEVGKFKKLSIEDKAEAKANSVSLTKEEKDRIKVIFILSLFVIFFWAGFEQAGGALSLYTDSFIDRNVFGFEIPTSWFQSVNPIFIVGLAPLFTILWTRLGNTGKEPSVPVKMGLGMILLGVGFLLMVGAVLERGGENPDTAIKADIMWLIGAYLIHTMGELCLSPIGLSMITKLAPVKMASVFMGVWMLSSFFANTLAGFSITYVDSLGAFNVFGGIALFVIVVGLILILLNKKLIAMMHGRG